MNISPDQKLNDAIDESIDVLTHFSIPLYLDIDDKPTPFGTGFFVIRENDIFLVSAAHVLDKAQSYGLYYYVTPNHTRHISGKMVRSKDTGNRNDDHIDIGVVKMAGEDLPPYPDVQKFPMDISYLKPCYLPRVGKHYCFIGFPATKTKVSNFKKSIDVKAYSYRSDPIPEAKYADHNVHINTHIVLPLNLKIGNDRCGNVTNFPKPQGMSGSPVVVLYEQDNTASSIFPVVAVAIEHRMPENVVIATDIKYVLEAIENAI